MPLRVQATFRRFSSCISCAAKEFRPGNCRKNTAWVSFRHAAIVAVAERVCDLDPLTGAYRTRRLAAADLHRLMPRHGSLATSCANCPLPKRLFLSR
jgi:hypothetical protein